MPLLGSVDAAILWNAAELTAVEECPGIAWELETGELLPIGGDLRRKAVTGVYVADDVSIKVPMDSTAGSDYMLLNADYKAKTARALRVNYDGAAAIYRSLTMTITKANPVIVNGQITMVEFTLVNTGTTKTES